MGDIDQKTLRLTLEVAFIPNTTPIGDLKLRLEEMVSSAFGEGILTGSTTAEIVHHSANVQEVDSVLSYPLQALGNGDYKLDPKESCWISVANTSLYILPRDEGVEVSAMPICFAEVGSEVRHFYVPYEDAESKMFSIFKHHFDLPKFFEWSQVEKGVSFYSLPISTRYELLEEYGERISSQRTEASAEI